MKLKILQSYKDVSIFQSDDYYYQFDYPKINLTNKTKYFIFPVVGKQFNALSVPRTASDYEVWGYSFVGEPDAETFLPVFNDPAYLYKAIVPQISIPAGPSGGVAGFNGYRSPADTGYTLGITGISAAEWTNFKSLVNGMPKGRRVLSANQYWWNDVDIFTSMGFNYYKNTIDGISYAGVSFTTPWLGQNTQDAASSFGEFLTLSKSEGLSFDYVATDNEYSFVWWLDGANSRNDQFGSGNNSDLDNLKPRGDARVISAIVSDPRFTTYRHPITDKSFADEFLSNYGDLVENDPLQVESSYARTNGFAWPNTTSVFRSLGFLKTWLHDAPTATEYTIDDTGRVYRYSYNSPTDYIDLISRNMYNTGNTGGLYFSGITGQPEPVVLMGSVLNDVKQVQAGSLFFAALNNNGTVIPWGSKDDLYYLEGTDASGNPIRSSNLFCTGQPVQLLGITLTGITQIAASLSRVCGLSADGSVRCWGYDGANSDVPAITAKQISGGFAHFMALRTNGTVACWGDDFDATGSYSGQSSNIPVGLSDVKQVAAGGYHSIALKNDGTVVCWGSNFDGSGTQVNQSVVPTGLAGVTQIAGGPFYSLALKNDGTVVCWGDNSLGILGTTTDGTLITTPQPATGQTVKILGITLSGIKTLPDSCLNNRGLNNNPGIRVLTTAEKTSAQSLLAPFIGVTLSTNFRPPSNYWTPYGCGESFAAACGCGWLGSNDIRKPAGYTWSAYSLFHYVAPAWNSAADNWHDNVYLKGIFTDTLQNNDYNDVKHLYYDKDPISSEEAVFDQQSNYEKRLRPAITSSFGGLSYYFPTQKNIVFPNITIPVARDANYNLYFPIRSGYIKNAETDNEKYMFAGYLDARTESACSTNELVRYPETDVYNGGITLDNTSYDKFRVEICYKIFIDYMKTTRQSHRSDPTLWQRFCPWIWFPDSGIYGPISNNDAGNAAVGNVEKSYWYELNFHLCLHGAKIFQIFEGDGQLLSLRLLSQRMLDIWRVTSFNSQTQPCSNQTGNTALPVDRLLLEDVFEKYVISGGRSLKTGEYIWRITIPPKYFNAQGIATLNRVGNDPDLPETISINSNAETLENCRGVWIKRLISTRPEYTIVAV
jgi:hypothetical protein